MDAVTYFAIVAAAFALVVSLQNLLLSRRLEHWRDLYLGLRHDYAKLHRERNLLAFLGEADDDAAGLRLVGKARGETTPKDAA